MNNKQLKLAFFSVAVGLLFTGGILLARYFSDVLYAQGIEESNELQKAKIALVIVTFHSYYHLWPGAAGPIDTNVIIELTGLEDAKINKQHIDFFKQNDCYKDTLGKNGRPLYFKYNDSFGTCKAYEGE